MPRDEEQVTERTKLLGHTAHDGRLNALQQEEEVQSLIESHVSKDEQALHNSVVGERLPYNDYTTIDWLHDLVRYMNVPAGNQLTSYRSKIPTATDLCIPSKASDTPSSQASMIVQAGSPPPSSASLQLA